MRTKKLQSDAEQSIQYSEIKSVGYAKIKQVLTDLRPRSLAVVGTLLFIYYVYFYLNLDRLLFGTDGKLTKQKSYSPSRRVMNVS